MWRRGRYRRERILLPGEHEGRRGFLKWGLAGTALLAVGGGTWLATRRTRPLPALGGPFQVLSPLEATVLLTLAERLVPPREGFPRPMDVDLPRRADAVVALAPEATQNELRQLVRLFDNALTGFLLDGQFHTFTDSTLEQQDARIAAWQTSRYALRRTGYKALKKIVYAAYYGSPKVWPAVGYPGPPPLDASERPQEPAPKRAEARHAEPKRGEGAPEGTAPQRPRPRPAAPAPRELEEIPAPRSGMDLPQGGKP